LQQFCRQFAIFFAHFPTEEIVSTQLEQDFASIETWENGCKGFHLAFYTDTHGKNEIC